MPSKKSTKETDEAYGLKLVLYFVLGLVWVKVADRSVFPLGAVLGVLIAQRDRFAIDRKIEYAILLVAAVIAFLGYGFFLNIKSLSSL